MKTVYPPDSLAAYLDAAQSLAAAHPGVVVLAAFLAAAGLASLSARLF